MLTKWEICEGPVEGLPTTSTFPVTKHQRITKATGDGRRWREEMYSLEITRSDGGSGSRREEIYAQAFTAVLRGS